MFQKRIKYLFLMTCILVGVTACGKSTTKNQDTVDGLDQLGSIEVVSREEGSGTRTTFADMIGLGKMSNSTDNSDDTTKKAQVFDDTRKVIDYVKKNKSAVGYVSADVVENTDEVKVLTVNGTKLSNKNVEKGTYDLTRSFYLTYTGKLRDVERDFISYVQGNGKNFLSDQSKGTITIHGSTSMSGLVEGYGKKYMKLNPNATIQVEASDSSNGLKDAMDGSCDLGMSSRELKDYEKELLNYETIAKDGIAVVVNKENPVKDLTTKQLKYIFKGSITKWNDVNTKEK